MTLRMTSLLVLVLSSQVAAPRVHAQVSVDTVRVSVDGHEMVLFITGSAGPTVVLEAGGSSHRAWGDLPGELASFSRVVTYDRPGYGLSQACGKPRTATVIAGELRQALTAAGVESPVLLVGWSHGGSFVRAFAAAYPERALGLLLLDPAIDGFYKRAARERPEVWNAQYQAQVERMTTSTLGHQGEWAAWDMTMVEMEDADKHLRVATTLVTSTRDEDGLQYIWIEEHRKWAASIPGVRHLLPENVGHAIHRERPELLKLVIRQMAGLEPITEVK